MMPAPLTLFPNGYSVSFERLGNWFHVTLRGRVELRDKVRCDNYREALTYRRAFLAIARNA